MSEVLGLPPGIVPLGVVPLGIVAALTIPCLESFNFAGRGRCPRQDTDDCLAPYFMSMGAVLGLSSAILRINSKRHEMVSSSIIVILISWTLLVVQTVSVHLAPSIPRRFKYGLFSACSAAVLLLSLLKPATNMLISNPDIPWIQLFAALVQLTASISLPQRPQAAVDGVHFAEEHAASVISLLCFSWAKGVQGPKSVQDLPQTPMTLSSLLRRSFPSKGGNGVLWRQLLQAYRFPLLAQTSLIIFNSLSQFATRLALHQLLVHIETASGESLRKWLCVVCIGAGLVADGISSAWVIWFTQMRMSSPATSLIKSLLFEKSTRLKLRYDTNQTTFTDATKNANYRLSLVDLMDNDAVSVCRAFSLWRSFPMALLKVLFDMTFLARLIGAKSILIGGAASFIFLPFSTTLSKNIARRQREFAKTHTTLFGIVSEAALGLRQIRFSSAERTWERKILGARNSELARLWTCDISLAALTLVSDLGPIMLSTAALSVYSYETRGLRPSVAFGALSLFGNLHSIVRELPIAAANLRESWMACHRVQRYLDQAEQQSVTFHGENIGLSGASIVWPTERTSSPASGSFVLESVSLDFPKGELSIITGNTGSGKSLLVAALLGEAEIQKGRVFKFNGDATNEKTASTAAVTQPPWIDDSTVRDNILFGSEFNDERYRRVLTACALERDIESMPDNDLTRAGRCGSMLSGGQRWRIALARALYSSADTLIIEDVLSAVDSKVAKWIYENALTGELAEGRTRILVTHHSELCSGAAKYIVLVQDGSAQGNCQVELLTRRTKAHIITPTNSRGATPNVHRERSQVPKPDADKIAIGSNWRPIHVTFLCYLRACGGIPACLIGVLVTLVCRASSSAHAWWLASWAKQQEANDYLIYNIGVFIMLSFGDAVAIAFQTLAFSSISVRASRTLFQNAVHSSLHASLAWMDRTSLGKILQTLNEDMYWVDHRVSKELNGLLRTSVQLGFIILTSLISGPYTGILSPILLSIFAFTASKYLQHSRKLFHLIPAVLPPILEHASSTEAGIVTIRAFGKRAMYINHMDDLLDFDLRLSRQLIMGQRWFHLRMSLYSAAFVVVAAGALVHNNVDAATAGFTISLAFQMKSTLSGISGKLSALQRCTSALGRVLDLAAVSTESQAGTVPPGLWPSQGAITVRNLSARYSEDLPLAIDNVSFAVAPCQRLGIVGRTGSGKTTLTSALLRFIDISSGEITIDGIDISGMKLEALRNAIGIIPQDPFLFSGTLRENLDIESMHTDEILQKTLRKVNFNGSKVRVSSENSGKDFFNLDTNVGNGGKDMSHGQRQLVCLVRALLSGCRILILDEATSSIDNETDTSIQKIIREEFRDVTIVVVTHRLSTVADLDSILVLDSGRVAEFGRPWELMKQKKLFHDMVEESEECERIKTVIKEAAQAKGM